MQNDIVQPRIWQSYVWHGEKCFFVSTIQRKYDTYQGETTGPETMVWSYDHEKQQRIGSVIGHMGGVINHQQICRCLIAEGIMLDENDPKHERFMKN